jgi:hypothetical protein
MKNLEDFLEDKKPTDPVWYGFPVTNWNAALYMNGGAGKYTSRLLLPL